MTGAPKSSLGLRVSEVPTPALLLDLDAFDSNCHALASHLGTRALNWRPHVKGHKSPVLAHRMIEAGAIGVTCANIGEAEEMVAGGVRDVLIANQLGSRNSWDRLAKLQRAAWVGVAIDHANHLDEAIRAGNSLDVSIPLVVEVDLGMGRAGVRSVDLALELSTKIVASGGLLEGVLGYEGHLLTTWPQAEKEVAIRESVGRLLEAANAIREASIPIRIVSCGGTGSYLVTSNIEGVTEIQAGGGCLMDRFYRELCHVDLAHALFVIASVISRPSAKEAILDAGWKALPDRNSLPICRDLAGVEVSRLYAEHMRLELESNIELGIGDRVVFIPGYSDATAFLHNEFLGIRDDVVVEVIPLSARGSF